MILDGFSALEDWIDDLLDELAHPDVDPALEASLEIHERTSQQAFDSRSAPGGGAWPPWQFTTYPARDHQTLELTGALRRSTQVGDANNIGLANDDELLFGSDLPYSNIHQDGGSLITGVGLVHRSGDFFIPPGTQVDIPARPFVGLTDESIDETAGIVLDHIITTLKG